MIRAPASRYARWIWRTIEPWGRARFHISGGSPNWSPAAKSIVPIAPSARMGAPLPTRASQRARWTAGGTGPGAGGPPRSWSVTIVLPPSAGLRSVVRATESVAGLDPRRANRHDLGTMLLGLDHLIIAVPDPDAAAAQLERTVGLACSGGGRHPLWGTYNRLAWLGDTYIELIGLVDRTLAPNGRVSQAVAAALDAGHMGLVSYALATDDADEELARLRADGSDLGDVEARSRTRPDGEVVRWRAAFPPLLGPAA